MKISSLKSQIEERIARLDSMGLEDAYIEITEVTKDSIRIEGCSPDALAATYLEVRLVADGTFVIDDQDWSRHGFTQDQLPSEGLTISMILEQLDAFVDSWVE